MENIIKLENISYSYHNRIPALSDISLEINEGESFAIIGANGSGKSTLLQVMNGLIYPSSGRFFYRGNEISEKSLKDKGLLRFFRERVGYVFQDPDTQLFCPTVFDELLYGPLQLEIDEREAFDRAFEVMEMLEIEDLKDRPSYMLSSGQKKKVAIGSVLTMNPEVLLVAKGNLLIAICQNTIHVVVYHLTELLVRFKPTPFKLFLPVLPESNGTTFILV